MRATRRRTRSARALAAAPRRHDAVILPVADAVAFVVASTALALAPGPDNLFVLTQSALHGRVAGLVVTLGLATGLIVHTSAVALGVAVVFQSSALAFTALKLVGAAYLLYLARGAFRAGASALPTAGVPPAGAWRLYRRGVVMNVTNPKVAIFFLAFLPQFADPARGAVAPQIVLCGALFAAVTLVVFGSVAWAAGFLGERLGRSARAQRVLNRLAALVFVALALRLVTAQR